MFQITINKLIFYKFINEKNNYLFIYFFKLFILFFYNLFLIKLYSKKSILCKMH